MSKRSLVIIIVSITFLIIIIPFIFRKEQILNWFSSHYLNMTYAAVLAMISGLIIEYIYRNYTHKSKFSRNTKLLNPKEFLGKLTLPNGEYLTITQYERIFGREDFVGLIISEKLLFIGKEHFKITQKNDGFYIKDLNTKNGTQVNDKEIKNKGLVKLEDESIIIVAQTLKILYNEISS